MNEIILAGLVDQCIEKLIEKLKQEAFETDSKDFGPLVTNTRKVYRHKVAKPKSTKRRIE